eukprot:gene13870-4818_t
MTVTATREHKIGAMYVMQSQIKKTKPRIMKEINPSLKKSPRNQSLPRVSDRFDHFREKDLNRTGNIVRVCEHAAPTRFKKFPPHLKKVSKERRPPMKRTLPESGSIDSNALGDSPLDIKVGVSVSPPTKRPKLHLFHDHIYQITESPRSLKKKLDRSLNDLKLAKKKLKCSQQRSRRLKNKVMSLKSVVKDLKKKGMISEACLNQLQHSLAGIPLEMMKRLTSQKKTGKGVKYSPETKSFALTLQFYSAKAYEFVRRTFNYALPHQAQIRRWYSKIPAEAGFTEPSFLAIKRKVESSNEKVVLSLMLDEMSIRKHIAWDGTKFRGYVDLGCGNESDDSSSVAKEVLVFMAVSVNGAWKIPLAYFFIDGLSGAERANLINVCLQRIWDTGAKVVSVTCDGPSCHFSMMSELGAKLDPNDLKCFVLSYGEVFEMSSKSDSGSSESLSEETSSSELDYDIEHDDRAMSP